MKFTVNLVLSLCCVCVCTIDLELEYETVETGKKGTHCIRVRSVYTYVL